MTRACFRIVFAALLLFAALPNRPAWSESGSGDFSRAQIDQLVAPIALYPDSLLSQVLMASTYPLEVIQAARWVSENPKVTGTALENAMQNQNWDPSVRALTAVPQVLQMMNNQLDWMQQLGDAFLGQQEEVLDAVQRLRALADKAGHLQSSKEQTVTRVSRPAGVPAAPGAPTVVYTIVAANPEVYFIPVYDPRVVFGVWPHPIYSPFFWHPPGWVAGNVFSFAAGVAVGAAIWGNVGWWNRRVEININRYNTFNRTQINNNRWVHNNVHRRGVPYRRNVENRFGDKGRIAARDKARQGQFLKGDAGMGGPKGIGGMGNYGKKGTGGMKGQGIGGMAGNYGMKGTGGTGGMKGQVAGGMKGQGTGGMKGQGAGGMKGPGTGGMKGPGTGGMKGGGGTGSPKIGGGMGAGSIGGMAGGGPVGGGMVGGGMVGGGMVGGGMVGGGMGMR